VFVRREDAERALAGLTEFGFETEHTNPSWIFKGFRDGVLVDVIFKVKSDVYFDDEMAARVRTAEYAGVEIPVLSPEDLVVTKAIAAEEEAPWHWYDALGVLAVNELDWEYLHERARKSPNRVLSLLHFAQSIDLPVPASAVRCLHDLIASRWD
jgi:predicted nucleotidyltransferase